MHKQARASSVHDLATQLCPSVCGLGTNGALPVSEPSSGLMIRLTGSDRRELNWAEHRLAAWVSAWLADCLLSLWSHLILLMIRTVGQTQQTEAQSKLLELNSLTSGNRQMHVKEMYRDTMQCLLAGQNDLNFDPLLSKNHASALWSFIASFIVKLSSLQLYSRQLLSVKSRAIILVFNSVIHSFCWALSRSG